jgi:hypothetical protein
MGKRLTLIDDNDLVMDREIWQRIKARHKKEIVRVLTLAVVAATGMAVEAVPLCQLSMENAKLKADYGKAGQIGYYPTTGTTVSGDAEPLVLNGSTSGTATISVPDAAGSGGGGGGGGIISVYGTSGIIPGATTYLK